MQARILALALVLAACGEKPGPSQDLAAAPPGPVSQVIAPATCTGDRLPVTGVCADAQPALFTYLDAKAELGRPACRWVTAQAVRSESEALVFRAQACPDERAPAWKFDGRQKLMMITTPSGFKQPVENVIAEIWDIPSDGTAQAKALEMLSEAPPRQRSRCVLKATPENKAAAGETFQLSPNEELMKEEEALAKGDPISACGPYGFTQETGVYWEARPGQAIFHRTGQDIPHWDPASFTFYAKGADGSWAKLPG